MNVRLLLMILLAGAILVPAGEAQTPQNNYNTQYVYPWAIITIDHCFYFDQAKTHPYPPGVTVQMSVKALQYSGWHGHDSGHRPLPIYLLTGQSGEISVTGQNGCANTGYIQMPDIAGYYTFEGHLISGGVSGINAYAKAYSVARADPLHPLQSLVPLPEDVDVMQVFALHPDQPHNNQTRYFVSAYVSKVEEIATNYKDLQFSAGLPGTADRVDFIRGSLPDGGIADDDYADTALGEWQARKFEYHDKGLEVDVANPKFSTTDSARGETLFQLLFSSMIVANCHLGAFSEDGVLLAAFGGAVNYWKLNPIMHVSCAAGSTVFSPWQPQ